MGWIDRLLQRFTSRAHVRDDSPMGQDAFIELAAERIRARLPARSVAIVGPLQLRVTGSSDDESDGQSIYLDNAWLRYRAEAAMSRGDILEEHLASLAATFDTVALTVDQVVPIVKGASWLDNVRELTRREGKDYEGAYEWLNEDLLVFYAQDTPTSLHYLNDSDLLGIDVHRDSLRRRAVGNLRSSLAGIEVHRGLVSMVTVGGNFESSLLLFDDLWAREGERLRGVPVAAVPTRELLLFADSADVQAVAKLQAMATDAIADAAYALTDQLFVLGPDGWRRHLSGS